MSQHHKYWFGNYKKREKNWYPTIKFRDEILILRNKRNASIIVKVYKKILSIEQFSSFFFFYCCDNAKSSSKKVLKGNHSEIQDLKTFDFSLHYLRLTRYCDCQNVQINVKEYDFSNVIYLLWSIQKIKTVL